MNRFIFFLFVCAVAMMSPVESFAGKKKNSCQDTLGSTPTNDVEDFTQFQMKKIWPEAWSFLKSYAAEIEVKPSVLIESCFKLASAPYKENSDKSSYESFLQRRKVALQAIRLMENLNGPLNFHGGTFDKVNDAMMGLKILIHTLAKPEQSGCLKDDHKMMSPSCLRSFFDSLPAHQNTKETQKEEASPPPDLRDVLNQRAELYPDTIYSAITAYNLQLQVTLSDHLVLDYEGPENETIVTLLRGIWNGKGDTAGIVHLVNRGPFVVEVKGPVHGHKRIIGCLEGNLLRLKKLIAPKDNASAYRNKVPSDLCVN